jgi:archaellum component FlaF (FlaF/FlaG flagellin family)
MKKGISSFVAVVLLIGFTVAVGAILSVWFTTFTRMQTAAVQAGAACAAVSLYVRAIGLTSDNVTLLVSNGGSDSVIVTSTIVTCGGVQANLTNPNLYVATNSQNITTITLPSGTCTQTNLGISLTAMCIKGGTTSTGCSEGSCFI